MAKVRGKKRIVKRLEEIPEAVRKQAIPALLQSAEEIVRTMRHLAPERTGDLRRSLVVTPPGGTTPPYSQPGGSQSIKENQVAITAGNTDVRYAHLVEYGTSKAPAQPFFWPAYRLKKKRAVNRIKRAASGAIRKTKRKA